MVINSQRTVYGLELQLSKLLDRPYTIRSNTTLNEKFSINTDVQADSGTYPGLKYYTIGVGGVGLAGGSDVYNFSKHKPTDAALFEHIPFVMRDVNNDLVGSERLKYRFRKVLLINGVEYAAYYLKLIDNNYTVNDIYTVDVTNEISKLSKFDTNNSDLLNPTPRNPISSLLGNTSAKYVTAAAKIKFSLTKTEIEEVNNVIKLLYGNVTKALTEIGVCSGVEASLNSEPIAVNVQINFHFEVELLTQLDTNVNNEIHRSLEIGGTEPLVL